MEMYEACDLLIQKLPRRPIRQETIWRECISQEEARRIVLSNGELPIAVSEKARRLLRSKLDQAFALVGNQKLVERIFSEI